MNFQKHTHEEENEINKANSSKPNEINKMFDQKKEINKMLLSYLTQPH